MGVCEELGNEFCWKEKGWTLVADSDYCIVLWRSEVEITTFLTTMKNKEDYECWLTI